MGTGLALKNAYNRSMLFFKREKVLAISAVLALASSGVARPRLEYIDFDVLLLLLNLMLIVEALKRLNLLEWAAVFLLGNCRSDRSVFFAAVLITFISSMIITNDVALISFVPIALEIGRKTKIKTMELVICQTLAANLGSSFTPMGNPQNLYMYSFYDMGAAEFFMITAPVAVLSLVILALIAVFKCSKEQLEFEFSCVNISGKGHVCIVGAAFAAALLSVFQVVDCAAALLFTMAVAWTVDKRLLLKADYTLLLTFVLLFIFIGNISYGGIVKGCISSFLKSPGSTYVCAILASQIISNVPAAILISGFTDYYKELLIGVNIGGMGTIIASMASLISYKLYLKEYPMDGREYIRLFTIYNMLGLTFFIPVIYFMVEGMCRL